MSPADAGGPSRIAACAGTRRGHPVRNVPSMSDPNPNPRSSTLSPLRTLNWSLVIGLAAIALIRPLFSIVGLAETLGKPVTPIVLTVAISLVWILVVGLTGVRQPLLTLVSSGALYAVIAILTSGLLLRGVAAAMFGSVSILVTNVVWGAVCGLLARGLQRLRGIR